jgi:pilus assembly protein Flp/PilA
MSHRTFSVFKDKRGVSALEYSILAGLIVLGVVAGIQTTGMKSAISGIFTKVDTALDAANQ